MRKIISALLCVAMLISSFVCYADTSDVSAGQASEAEAEALPRYIDDLIGKVEGSSLDDENSVSECIGLLKAVYPETKIYDDLTSNVTRADFLVMLTSLVVGTGYLPSSVFSDVPADNTKLLEALSYAVDSGLVSVSDTFRPDDFVTYPELCKMVVVATGYDFIAKQKGGYPAGYMSVAKQVGLLDGIISVDVPVTAADVYVVLKNVLTVSPMEQIKYGDTETFEVARGENILSKRYDIYLIEGVVNADETTGITSEFTDCAPGEIVIGTKVYKNLTDRSLIGYKVRAYVRDTGSRDEVVYIRKYDNRELFIDEFTLIDDYHIRVPLNNDKTKDFTIYKSYASILNNVAAPYLNLNDYVNRDDVTLYIVDNNNDGVYDVVKVYDWDYMQAGKLDSVNFLVFDMNTPSNLLNLNSDDASVKIYECTGENVAAIGFDSIKESDILTYIISSNQKSVTVFKSANKFSASLDEYNQTEQKISLGGVFYELSDYAISKFPSVTLGIDTTIYLDATGAVIVISQSGKTKYGYIVDMAKEGSLSSVYKVKMFTHTGEMSIIPVEDKVLIDAVSKSAKDLFDMEQSLSADDRMVKYATNASGNINIVDFAEMADDTVLPFTEVKPANNNFTCYYDDTYNKTGSGFFGTAFIADGNTLMFHIPKADRYKSDDERYMIRTYSSYRNGDLDVRAYDMEPGSGPKVILCFNDRITTPVDEYTSAEVVMEITQGLNDEGEQCKLLKTYNGTAYKTYYVLKDSFGQCSNFSDVTPGDIVALSVYQNELEDIKIQYSYSSNAILQSTLADKRMFFKGYVYAYNSKLVQLWNTMNPEIETPTISKLNALDFREQTVIFVDIYKDASGNITKAMARYKPLIEIKDYVHAGIEADFMVANMAGYNYDAKWIYRVVER